MSKVVWIKRGVIVACSCALMACSSYYASNKQDAYLKSRNGISLVVPPSLTSENLSHFYDLPSQDGSAKVSIKPPGV